MLQGTEGDTAPVEWKKHPGSIAAGQEGRVRSRLELLMCVWN